LVLIAKRLFVCYHTNGTFPEAVWTTAEIAISVCLLINETLC